MRLTRYTDYAMRVLLYLGTRPDRLSSIAEISTAYHISQNHLMKVVNDLARAGYVASVRGRSGGIRLGAPAEEINVGKVVRHTEDDFRLADCPNCVIAPACGLQGALNEALEAFLGVLDRYTLADLLVSRSSMRSLFGIPDQDASGSPAFAGEPGE
ncbi:Rrf2 family transcriptional regulator [Sphingomonas sp. Sphisp140]|uniref:Rrf2 family transcriptional regulator n=1 Tax=unclassified Sphingomonas TaxID=196159 RepID=UPI0039B0665B